MSAASFYALDAIFPRLLRESPYVTKLAEEADYFFVSLVRDNDLAQCQRASVLIVVALPTPPGFWALLELPVEIKLPLYRTQGWTLRLIACCPRFFAGRGLAVLGLDGYWHGGYGAEEAGPLLGAQGRV